MTLVQSLTITRGDDYGAVVTFDQDIAGFTDIAFTVRETYATTETDNVSAVFSASLLAGGVTAAGARSVAIDISNTATVTWSADKYVYDIQVTTTAGKIYTTQRGPLYMAPDVTR